MVKAVFKKLCDASRLAVILLAILSLGVSGADAAARLFAFQTAEIEQEEVQLEGPVMGQAHDAEDGDEGMATDSRPYTEQSACFQSTTSSLPSHQTGRYSQDLLNGPSGSYRHDLIEGQSAIKASTCLVSGQLGHQFTLVGARPSGTS